MASKKFKVTRIADLTEVQDPINVITAPICGLLNIKDEKNHFVSRKTFYAYTCFQSQSQALSNKKLF